MNREILVTGANGQLGKEIRRIAESSDDNFIFTGVEELDITNYEAIEEIVTNNKVNIIINCAAYTYVDGAETEEAKANLINSTGPKHLAQAALKVGATLIHISTDYVFDGHAFAPYTEEHPTAPLGAYGRGKLDGERCVIESGCNYIIIRTSWLYSTHGGNFVDKILDLCTQREQLNIVVDQVGTPTFAGDLADAIAYIISSRQLDKQGLYHFSNEGVCSWYDFAHEICHQSGSSCKITPILSHQYPSKAQRPHYTVLDKSKFKESFNFEIPHWKESLERCLNILNSDKNR